MEKPVVNMSLLAYPQYDDHKERLDVSLRLIADYNVNDDNIYARMDVLINCSPGDSDPTKPIKVNENTKQFNITLLTTDLKKSCLMLPKSIEGGISIQVNGKDLVGKLRALADRLEYELPA